MECGMASGRRWRGCVAQPFDRDRTACSALWPTTADRRTPSSASHQHGRRGHSSRDRPHLVSACPRTDEAEAVSPFCDVRHAQRGVRGWRRANSISAQCRRDSPRRPLWTPRPHQPRRRSPTGLRRLCAPRQTSRTRRVPSQARNQTPPQPVCRFSLIKVLRGGVLLTKSHAAVPWGSTDAHRALERNSSSLLGRRRNQW